VTNISQSSVAIHLSCGRINDNFSRKLIAESKVKEFRKLISIWRSYRQDYNGTF